jgi:hypothetical protein
MTEEERGALHRANRVACRAALAANERLLAGNAARLVTLRANWRALEFRLPEFDLCVEPVTAQNRDCIC